MNSSMNEYSTSDNEILKQFRKNLSDVLTPDVTDNVLLKWLRAKNFSLRKAEELYRENVRTRAVFKSDEIEKIWKAPEVIQKYEFANHLGIAKDGTPIHYVAMGRGDLKGFILSVDVYDIGKYCTYTIEKDLRRCKEQSKKLGREIDEITYIIDMEGFALRQVWFQAVLELGLDLLRTLQDIYPEVWKNVLVVNAPSYFQTIFNLFKPIFRHTFLDKIYVVSRDRTASLLLKYIDADVLPAFLGGKRVDSKGNPMCSEFMKLGGPIPEKYYLRNRAPLQPTDPGVEDIYLPPKCLHNYIVVVRAANSVFHVELRTVGGSIPGIIMYRKFGSDPENLDLPGRDEYLDPHNKRDNVEQCGPYMHLQTHTSPVDNYCHAPWPGIYIFRLDNTYSWLTPRRCIIRIRVLPPSAESQEENKQD